MPYDAVYRASGVAFRFHGVVTGAEIYGANEEMYAHRYEPSLRYCVFDLAESTHLDVDMESIMRTAERDREQLANQPEMLTVIVATDPLQFGLARMWEAYVDGAPVRVAIVRTRDAALEALHSYGADV